MTVKEMDARLDEIERELDEIQERTLLDRFCVKCPHICVKAYETSEYGYVCRLEHAACPSGFWPYGSDCPRASEYEEICARRDELIQEHKRLCDQYMEALEA